jgi:uncharacterized protein (DUF433 family)
MRRKTPEDLNTLSSTDCAMTLMLQAEPWPLRVDAGGVVRVGNTRVTLESVVLAYKAGETAEQIAQSFDTLELGDVCGVITYYLKHRAEVEAYLDQYARLFEERRAEAESQGSMRGIRELLLARRGLGR